MKYLSVCSGIEAASKAWEPIGWKPVAFSEIEPFPSAVLKHHWPKVPNLGDMSKYEQWNIQSGSIDLLVGGTPCQSFSVAGLRQGLKDPRGNLMLTYLAIAERLKPRWLVWENVPGVLSSNGGKDFGSFLGALGELGYEWAYRVLDAQWFGVAQRRRRVFVVAHLGEGNLAAKVLFESESVRRDTPPSREAGKGVATNVEAGVGVSPTITQCKGSRGGCSDEALMEIRAVHEAINAGIPDVCATIDCGLAKQVGKQLTQQAESFYFPIPIHDQATRNAGKRGNKQDGKGNGLGVGKPGDPAPTLTKGDKHAIAFQTSELRLTGKLTEKSVCPTLKANTKAGDTEVKVVLYENHPNDSRVTGPHDVAPSCVSRYGTGGGNVPLVQEAIAFEPGIATREGSESRFVKELSPTLRKEMGDNQVAVSDNRMAVRRLTPRECERLQGFDDDHTLIPWRNKPADQCPDGPRYKALGNSMAVPCMAWIGKRIDAVEKTK
jgi:DNA (cytosine-5)-methyltransferase 1